MSYFPELYARRKNKIKVQVDLSNYATKSDLKSATHVDTSKFSKEVDLANLKSNVDELYIVKLNIVLVDLRKLSNSVNNDVVKKTIHDESVERVNTIQTIDTSDSVKKADQYITTKKLNKLTKENFVEERKQAS